MPRVARFGVSMDGRLLEGFDRMIAQKGYSNRSEAIRDLIRDQLVDEALKEEATEVVGTIALVYNHEIREINDTLIELEHQFHEGIISSLHIHLDRENCFEVLIVRGKARDVRRVADRLIGVRGVKHGKLLTTTTGRGFF